MDPVLLDLNDSVSGGGGEQPTQRLVIKTEDGRNECEPVEEAQVPTDDQNHLGTTPEYATVQCNKRVNYDIVMMHNDVTT